MEIFKGAAAQDFLDATINWQNAAFPTCPPLKSPQLWHGGASQVKAVFTEVREKEDALV